MSHDAHGADHGHEGKNEGKKMNPWIILIVVIVIYFAIQAIMPERSSEQSHEGKSPNQSSNTGTTSLVIEAKKPDTFSITDSFSEVKVMPNDYYIAFVCDQPYEIQKGNGEIVKAEAGKCANIGVKSATESTENSVLKFRTSNGTKTTMTIIYSPMKLSNN